MVDASIDFCIGFPEQWFGRISGLTRQSSDNVYLRARMEEVPLREILAVKV